MISVDSTALIYDLRIVRALLSPDGNQPSLICPESHWDALVRVCMIIEEIEHGHPTKFCPAYREACEAEAGLGSPGC